jgi:ABC-type branched-subunit amino acid transport system substrate-binding protein
MPCDTLCLGEIDLETGSCHADRLFYIGGLVDYSSFDKDEIISTMEFAVQLINNHSDGWFDETRQVTLILEVADSMCSVAGGRAAAMELNHWAVNTSAGSTTLDGIIGATCSDGSIGSAQFGNSIIASQISYASTSTSLSDKDEYYYFARTCFADESQGELLADVLDDLGLTPFISVVASTDSYAQSLSFSIAENYQSKGHTVLLMHSYTPAADDLEQYTLILDALAASGAPVTVLVMYVDEVDKLLAAAAQHPVYRDNTMVWVGIEMWINVLGGWNRKGMLGLKPYVPSAAVTDSYMAAWAALDPDAFVDSDSDRSGLGSNTLFVADAVFALAQAFQTITSEDAGSDVDALKREVFSSLVSDVSFTGKET